MCFSPASMHNRLTAFCIFPPKSEAEQSTFCSKYDATTPEKNTTVEEALTQPSSRWRIGVVRYSGTCLLGSRAVPHTTESPPAS